MKRTTINVEVDVYDILEDIESSDLVAELNARSSEYLRSAYDMTPEFCKRVLWAMEKSEDFTMIEIMDTRNQFGL